MSICVYLWLIFLSSCGSKPTDLRTLIPADSLVYLESNDLGAVMKTITDRPAFREAAKTVPDFSVLNGVRLAVAVTGFETKEQPVTDEASVLNFQPRFVAVLETNAWHYQALAFTEQKLGEFINNVYDGEVLLETSDKHEGKYFVWKANDGRKAYALVQGSLIFFGNDETAIEKSLAVKRGEADSISKNPKITNADRLAFGYVSPDGVAQIANLLGVKYASEASDEPEVRSSVALVVPQVLRSLVQDVTWTVLKVDDGFEDTFTVSTPAEVAAAFSETLSPNPSPDLTVLDKIGASSTSVTFYNLKNPQIAWRSVLFAAFRNTDPLTAKIGALYSGALFEPYGIKDPEEFLGSIKGSIVTAKNTAVEENGVVVAAFVDEARFRKSLSSTLIPTVVGFENGRIEIWKSKDDDIAADLENGVAILGTTNSLLSVLPTRSAAIRSTAFQTILQKGSPASAVTIGVEPMTAGQIAEVLGITREAETKSESVFTTETRFNKKGIERRTVSDFGFIGWICTQFGKE